MTAQTNDQWENDLLDMEYEEGFENMERETRGFINVLGEPLANFADLWARPSGKRLLDKDAIELRSSANDDDTSEHRHYDRLVAIVDALEVYEENQQKSSEELAVNEPYMTEVESVSQFGSSEIFNNFYRGIFGSSQTESESLEAS